MRDDEDDGGTTRSRSGLVRRVLSVPIAAIGTIALALGATTPAEAAANPTPKAKARAKHLTNPAPASRPAALAPADYLVVEGDTISGIAERFGLPTAEILALNGLGWSTLIFPGQRLALVPAGSAAPAPPPAPTPVQPEIARHTVAAGDTLSGIAAANGVGLDDLLSANGLSRSSLIFPGQTVVLPTMPSAAAPQSEAAAPTAPGPAPAPTHIVVPGDTLIDIADRAGLTLADLVAANGLEAADPILPGQVLSLAPPVEVALVASVSMPLNDETRANARIIVEVGRALGVPDRGIVIALAAAAQESGLRNLHHGDQDSLGLFQQRPSQGWGTNEQVLDPVRATTAFYGGPANPNAGTAAGLLDVEGWESLTLTQAAQAVQRSAHPDHYAKWERQAADWLSELG